MNKHPDIERICAAAERDGRCLIAAEAHNWHSIGIRVEHGELVRPHHGLYARAAYWNGLDPKERTRHVIRALSQQRPERVFAGVSAAAILHLEYGWNLHADGTIVIAAPTGRSARSRDRMRHIIMRHPPVVITARYRLRDGGLKTRLLPDGADCTGTVDAVRITSPARTLVDCALALPFEQAMPMFDSALRRNLVERKQIIEVCDDMRTDCGTVLRLLHYTNPLNENGGESTCYATVIDEGFAVPELQHVFLDPDNPSQRYRADFIWHTPDGRVIVLEYDGARKYVDPAMTGGRTIRGVVQDERARQDALLRAGVTTVIRTDWEEVRQRIPLIRKLTDAGVPMRVADPRRERPTDVAGLVW